MVSRRHLALGIALTLFSASPANAARRDAHAEAGNDGVEVIIRASDDAAHDVGNGRASTCHWTATPYYDANVGPPPNVGPRPDPEHELYLVFCDGHFVGLYWLGPANFPAVDAAAMAGEVIDQIPVDLAEIRSKPTGKAVTGITSYFWVDGYDGAPINETVNGFGVTVTVSITLGSVVWDFGDGTPPVSTGLGEAWPSRSSVHHTYRDKGLHTVRVTITMPAGFAVDGGAVVALAPIVRTATIPYQVDEVQAVRDQ